MQLLYLASHEYSKHFVSDFTATVVCNIKIITMITDVYVKLWHVFHIDGFYHVLSKSHLLVILFAVNIYVCMYMNYLFVTP